MELKKLLKSVEMFAGLDEAQIDQLTGIFKTHKLNEGDVLFAQGDQASDLFIVREGFVEVVREGTDSEGDKVIVNLGPGQSVGEMALVDKGKRSATIRAVSGNTEIVSVSREAFETFCDSNTDIGYRVMRNIAADLSFRLRRRQV